MLPTGYSDLVVVEDGQSLHCFSFTVKLQQTRESLGVGCWDEEDEEEKGHMKEMEKVEVGDKTEEETQLKTMSVMVGIWFCSVIHETYIWRQRP